MTEFDFTIDVKVELKIGQAATLIASITAKVDTKGRTCKARAAAMQTPDPLAKIYPSITQV